MKTLNLDQKNKDLIKSAENGRYSYYDYTEESCRSIAKKPINEVTNQEWRSLVQMLYPRGLICSGIFEPFLVFNITNAKREDPPIEHWHTLDQEGSDGILLERIISALTENEVNVNETWTAHLQKAKKGEAIV